ncbi:hypothetical protein LSAT2_025243 [Lamellibrachia satsuma]|nr:hypothetical protein LSAT2_025243 [Lamellibrachia satsuma]
MNICRRGSLNRSSSQQISELQHSLADRERLVQNLQKSHKLENADVIRRLREETHELRADLKTTHKNKQRLDKEKRHLEAELDSARQDYVTLNEELTARCKHLTSSVASFKRDWLERSSSSEQQLREQFERLENTIMELHIANAELKALRAENRNLRLMTLSGLGSSPGGSTSMDLNAFDAQQQISELRDSYSVSVKTLEVTDKN